MPIETGTSPKHRYELIKATLLVIVGALITITIVYGIEYFTPKPASTPLSTEILTSDEATTITEDQQPAEQPKKYSQEELNQIFEMDKKKPGTKLFYSEKLGVGFTYEDNGVSIREVDNGIYFDYPSGTYTYPKLEVFTKDPKDTLKQAVTNDFLTGANPEDCFVVTNFTTATYNTAEIEYTIPEDLGDKFAGEYNIKCPEKARPYAKTNGAQYFFMQPEKPSKYGFVRIGQDIGPLSGFSETRDWSETIRILK
jgi:hypothetical protein